MTSLSTSLKAYVQMAALRHVATLTGPERVTLRAIFNAADISTRKGLVTLLIARKRFREYIEGSGLSAPNQALVLALFAAIYTAILVQVAAGILRLSDRVSVAALVVWVRESFNL